MFYGQNESMKFFLAKSTASDGSTEPAWLAYFRSGMPARQAGLVDQFEAVDLAKKISLTHFVHRTFR